MKLSYIKRKITTYASDQASMLSTRGNSAPSASPGDIWQCLETFLIVMTWGEGAILASSGKTPVSDTAEHLTTSAAALHNKINI